MFLRVFLGSCDVNPAGLEGPAHSTLAGPGLLREQACLCTDRCKLPLCVKLENPELSREECDHSLYCSLLHSHKCVYMCVREKDGMRETDGKVRTKRVWKRRQRGKLACASLAHLGTLVWRTAVCFQSELRGAAYGHPTTGHMTPASRVTHGSWAPALWTWLRLSSLQAWSTLSSEWGTKFFSFSGTGWSVIGSWNCWKPLSGIVLG